MTVRGQGDAATYKLCMQARPHLHLPCACWPVVNGRALWLLPAGVCANQCRESMHAWVVPLVVAELRALNNKQRKTGKAAPKRLTPHQKQVVARLIEAYDDDVEVRPILK